MKQDIKSCTATKCFSKFFEALSNHTSCIFGECFWDISSLFFQGIYTAEALPFVIFGGMLLLSSMLVLLLQETSNVKLPETMEEARYGVEQPQEKEKAEVIENPNFELAQSKNNNSAAGLENPVAISDCNGHDNSS